MFEKHYSERELAARWNISCRTLQVWRQTGKGPMFLRLGRAIRYPDASVTEFEASAFSMSTAVA